MASGAILYAGVVFGGNCLHPAGCRSETGRSQSSGDRPNFGSGICCACRLAAFYAEILSDREFLGCLLMFGGMMLSQLPSKKMQ